MKSTTHTNARVISVLIITLSILFFAVSLVTAADYILGPGDVLKITVYDNDDLATIARISDDGNINMPLLDQIKIDGLTISVASALIADLLADGYIINPQVDIFVQEFRSKRAFVLGQVNRPGIYEMSGPITILEMISKAGGVNNQFGDTATIKRKNNGDNDVIIVKLRALLEKGDFTQNIDILGGDSIYVSKAGMCYVTGQVRSPNAYKCGDNMTVLKLITRAGGFTGRASKSSVRIVRMVNEEKTLYKDVDMETIVQPEDIIIVPESFF